MARPPDRALTRTRHGGESKAVTRHLSSQKMNRHHYLHIISHFLAPVFSGSVTGEEFTALVPCESGLVHSCGPGVAARRLALPEVGQVFRVTHKSPVQIWVVAGG